VIPTLAMALGLILTIETAAHISADDSNTVDLFGISFDPTRPVTWVAAAVLLVGGYLIARLTWRRIAEAWDRAATVARDRGYLA
jgi:branched-chain amino acid transport system permease protein